MTYPVTDLACMDGENMAAVALQLQHTARQAEDRIYRLEQRLRAASNRPTKVQRSTALRTGLVPDPLFGYQSIGPNGGGSYVTDFDNTGVQADIDSTSRTLFARLGEGLYEFGVSCNLIASGAVNDNTYRIVRIVNFRLDPTAVLGEVEAESSSLTLYESNTGIGVDFDVTAVFRMEAGDRVDFVVQHANASSNLNSSIGAMVWLTKLSSNDGVVVT